jgi:hypothetical protein
MLCTVYSLLMLATLLAYTASAIPNPEGTQALAQRSSVGDTIHRSANQESGAPDAESSGAEVVPGSEFDLEMARVMAGDLDDIDWTHYKNENGTWVYTSEPVSRLIRRGTDWGTLCAYADVGTCDGGRYWCWNSAYDGQCFALWFDGNNVGIRSMYRKFALTNFWLCWGAGSNTCGPSDLKLEDRDNGRCFSSPWPRSWSGIFKWAS